MVSVFEYSDSVAVELHYITLDYISSFFWFYTTLYVIIIIIIIIKIFVCLSVYDGCERGRSGFAGRVQNHHVRFSFHVYRTTYRNGHNINLY